MWSNSEKNHQRTTTNNYKCILCNLTFNDDISLRKHFEMHTPQPTISAKNNSEMKSESSSSSSSLSNKNNRQEHQQMVGVPSVEANFNQQQIDLLTLQQVLIAQQRQQGASRGVTMNMASNQNQHNFLNQFGGPNGIHLAQQLILARAAAAFNPQALLAANAVGCMNPVQGPSPYSYLMSAAAAANFSPFYLSLNNLLAAGGNGLLVNDAQQTILLSQTENPPQNFTEPLNVGVDGKNRQNNHSIPVVKSNDPPSAMSTPNSYCSSSVESSTLGSPNERTNNRTASVIMSPEEVEQRISMLIAQNEAVLEPSPVLSKRRSYTSRQQHHGSLDYTSASASSPSRSLTTGRGFRSQSLVETSSPPVAASPFHANLLHSSIDASSHTLVQSKCHDASSSSHVVHPMNALNFHAQVESDTLQATNYNCKFCDLGLRHLDEMKRHEEKCARREECKTISTTPIPSGSLINACPSLIPNVPGPSVENCRFPLKKRISAAAKAAFDASNAKIVPTPLADRAISVIETETVTVDYHQKIENNNRPVIEPMVVVEAPRFVASDPRLNQIPKVSLSSSEELGTFHPYCVTVKVPGALSLEPTRAGRKAHQVTQPTNSSSLRRISPCIDSKNNSEYTSWSQIAVSPLESKLNIMMMDGCTMRSQRPFLNYTVAQKDLNLMRMTHSSYWTYSKRLLQFPSSVVVQSSATPELCKSPDEMKNCTDSSISPMEISPVEDTVTSEIEDEKLACSTSDAVGTTVATTSAAAMITGGPSSSLSRELLKNILTANSNHHSVKKITVCNGGYKTNEAYTYVRGRGRGRYVCARCGIRCKKPSMLKKHIRTHLNVRPYSCPQCMFSFKTKGNLTKHLKSKSHSKKCASLQPNDESNSYRNEQACGTGEEDTDETLSEDEFET